MTSKMLLGNFIFLYFYKLLCGVGDKILRFFDGKNQMKNSILFIDKKKVFTEN